MLFSEPILLGTCLFNAFAYGVLYMLFEAFPIVFQEERGWSPVASSLPFLAELVGVFLAVGGSRENLAEEFKVFVCRRVGSTSGTV
jgi:hypothetical protein